jgi:hypothetical protein
MRKSVILGAIIAVFVAGCGSSAPKQTADCNIAAGAASGDALVGSYSTASVHQAG